jgi:NAD(P)-dependent dehydrogenase (short-subunit alcohol dehydrogenase family)
MAADRLDPLAAFRLDGKVAVVTGASAGLGTRFARVLDAAGADVVVTARRAERLASLAEELTDALPVQCDVADIGDIDRLFDATLERFGRVDVVVNNAGIRNVIPAVDEGEEAFESVLRVNLTAPFALARRAARSMIERGEGGSIINISSIFGVVGSGQLPLSSYAAAKGGLNNLTRELAAAWGRHGIRVNAICPGFYASEMTEDAFEDERMLTWIRKRTPMGRVGEPSELDGALLYLASGASTYTTGQCLGVDGGWTII